MSLNDPNVTLDAMEASLAAFLPGRYVQRSLADPMNTDRGVLEAGLLCIVSNGGGGFANYLGREADLGHVDVQVVGFVQVDEKSAPAEVERAELALLLDVRRWIAGPGPGGYGDGVDSVYPESFLLSRQMTHPYGWMTLALRVKC